MLSIEFRIASAPAPCPERRLTSSRLNSKKQREKLARKQSLKSDLSKSLTHLASSTKDPLLLSLMLYVHPEGRLASSLREKDASAEASVSLLAHFCRTRPRLVSTVLLYKLEVTSSAPPGGSGLAASALSATKLRKVSCFHSFCLGRFQ